MADIRLSLEELARRLMDAGLVQGLLEVQDVTLTGVAQDSRKVRPGDLFLAWKGVSHDAHAFLSRAAEAGAVAAVVERLVPDVSIPQLQVHDGRLAAAVAADAVLGSPWTELFLTGITGTNGKTTTAVLGRHLLGARGPARSVGTLGLVQEDGSVRPETEGLTTPGPVQLTGWIREMADDGVAFATLEASSHALEQRRLDGLRFDCAVFTTLGRDHLDYHADFEVYRAAKARLLELLKPGGWAVVRRDEEGWQTLDVPRDRTLTFGIGAGDRDGPAGGLRGAVHVRATGVELRPDGSSFRLSDGEEEVRVILPFLGRFNVENALAAAAVARAGGLPLRDIAEGLTAAPQIPGRLQRVVDEPFTVLIDFAHTPDALEGVLSTLQPIVEGRLMVLFGAGGDRDRGKRPEMAEVVARFADLAIVTSDNPRTEDPDAIIDDVLPGLGDAPFLRVTDRREAMAAALEEANPGDLLLLAGKGHETYQVLGTEKHPFDEASIVLELLEEMGREEAS